jgi:hypothetical protein
VARDVLDLALRDQRMKAIGAEPDVEKTQRKPIRKQVTRLTQEQYDALDPRQRAAVDFNALLVGAVRKDRQHQEQYETASEEERTKYEGAVTEMFGKDRGSETYAPETMAVLRQIDYKDPNADLDDFLGLKATIKVKDLDDLEPLTTPPAVTVSGEAQISDMKLERVSLARNLAEGVRDLETTLADSKRFLQTVQAGARHDRGFDVESMGGKPTEPKIGLGYGEGTFSAEGAPTNYDGYFQQAFAMTLAHNVTMDEVVDAVRVDRPDLLEAFKTYAANRQRNNKLRTEKILGTPEEVTTDGAE